MEKKRSRNMVWALAGFAAGALLVLLCWFTSEKLTEHRRYQNCLKRDYSFLNLREADVKEEVPNGTDYQFKNLTVHDDGENMVFLDSGTGQMRQYYKGVLWIVLVAEWGGSAAPSYRQYEVRSREKCEAMARLLEENSREEINKMGGRIWQMASGETFVD